MANSTERLKQATASSHRKLESSIFAQILVSGMITERLWANYLLSKYVTSIAIELRLPILDELGISRRHLLSKDLSLVTRGIIPKATLKYTDKLMSAPEDKLLAHVYVGYMGDLFGGKIIARNVAWPSMHLDRENSHSLANKIRGMVVNNQEDLVDEAVLAFEMTREIYDELL